jgi:hypothetical protein
MENVFVSFTTNNNYAKIAETMIKSVHKFSKHKIILYCVNFDKPDYAYKYDRLICKNIKYNNSSSIYFLKPLIILDSIVNMKVKNGVYIESDDILTKYVDNIFEECKRITNYPLCPIHPKDPNNQKNLMDLLKIKKKSMPYVHGHVVYTKDTLDFIKEWYTTCIQINNVRCNWDETVLNLIFWKKNINDYINYVYDPFYNYVYDIKNINNWKEYDYLKEEYNTTLELEKIYMWHGCKDLKECEKILDLLSV